MTPCMGRESENTVVIERFGYQKLADFLGSSTIMMTSDLLDFVDEDILGLGRADYSDHCGYKPPSPHLVKVQIYHDGSNLGEELDTIGKPCYRNRTPDGWKQQLHYWDGGLVILLGYYVGVATSSKQAAEVILPILLRFVREPSSSWLVFRQAPEGAHTFFGECFGKVDDGTDARISGRVVVHAEVKEFLDKSTELEVLKHIDDNA
ncbi:MAG: hypothetical protein M1831_002967 [Alyxoria varia]|nr:MAG: hypothetical protein M1831_002967 [Alyxoria varia]